MADQVQQFHELVRSLMSADNEIRNTAEVQIYLLFFTLIDFYGKLFIQNQ